MAARKKKAAAPPPPAPAAPRGTPVQATAPPAFRCSNCGIGAEVARPLASYGYAGNCEWCDGGMLVPLVEVGALIDAEGASGTAERIAGAANALGEDATWTVQELAEYIADGDAKPGKVTRSSTLIRCARVAELIEAWAEKIEKAKIGNVAEEIEDLGSYLFDFSIILTDAVLLQLSRWAALRYPGRGKQSPIQEIALEWLTETEACSDAQLSETETISDFLRVLQIDYDTRLRMVKADAKTREELDRRDRARNRSQEYRPEAPSAYDNVKAQAEQLQRELDEAKASHERVVETLVQDRERARGERNEAEHKFEQLRESVHARELEIVEFYSR